MLLEYPGLSGAIDAIINSICVAFCYPFYQKFYSKYCLPCRRCCYFSCYTYHAFLLTSSLYVDKSSTCNDDDET